MKRSVEAIDILNIQVGKRIKKHRKTLGLTKKQLAEKTNISVRFLANIESGRKTMDVDILCIFAKTLGVPIDFILAGNDKLHSSKIHNLLTQLPDEEREIAELFIMTLIKHRSK